MNIIDFGEKQEGLVSQNHSPKFTTDALHRLTKSVVKVLMHLDGAHGVYRKYCDPERVVQRAKSETYLLLDLGHVVRLYFGDDYFDLHLDTEISNTRSVFISDMVAAVIRENERNFTL